MEFPRRVFDGEGVKADVDFGPTLMLNRNRCILCTRCVRFMKEIDGDAQIGIVDRGNGSEIATFEEEGVHSLLSGNLMDVCPVGAITTRDYRFKSRPWDNPDAVDTICTLCSKGCNTTAWIKAKPEWAKGARLIRFTPRFNPEVNGYWMCDIGRFDYHWIEGDDRLTQAARADGAGRAAAGVLARRCIAAAERLSPPSARTPTAFGSSSPRTRRTRSCSCSAARRRADRQTAAACRRAGASPKAAAGRHEIHGAGGRRAECERRARSGLRRRRAAIAAPPTCRRCARTSKPAACQALYVFDPGPAGSLGDVSWIVEARRARQAAAAHRSGRAADRPRARGRLRAARRPWVEKDATYTNDQGRLQGASRAIRARRARRRTTGRFSSTSRWRSACRCPTRRAAQVRAAHAARFVECRRMRELAVADVRAAGQRASLAAGDRTRRSDGSGTSCSRTCRR